MQLSSTTQQKECWFYSKYTVEQPTPVNKQSSITLPTSLHQRGGAEVIQEYRKWDHITNTKDCKPVGGLAQVVLQTEIQWESLAPEGIYDFGRSNEINIHVMFGTGAWHRIPSVKVLLIPGLSFFLLSRCGIQSALKYDNVESWERSYLLRLYSIISDTQNFIRQVAESPLAVRKLKLRGVGKLWPVKRKPGAISAQVWLQSLSCQLKWRTKRKGLGSCRMTSGPILFCTS